MTEINDDLMRIPEAAAYLQMKPGALANLRYAGRGPKYLAPSPKIIFYKRTWIDEWLNASARTGTAVAA
jgi:hypothetical protein